MKKISTSKTIIKKTILYILLTVVAVCGGLFLKTFFTKNILVLRNGNVIAAEEIWTLGDTTYYRINKNVRSVKQIDVSQIVTKRSQGSGNLAMRVVYCLKATKDNLIDFIPSVGSRNTFTNSKDTVDKSHTGFFIFVVLVLAVCSAVFFLIRQYAKPSETSEQNGNDSVSDSGRYHPVLSSVRDIEEFFLNVFRCQLGAMADAPANIIPISTLHSGSNRVYDLQVEHHGKWKSRRITIGLLGEGTGSKSQCFYVVYDTHMVIKIPSEPIKDFKAYVRRIKQEAAIIKKLAPLECIIPNISVILEKTKIVPDTAGLRAKTLEEKYIHWLETYPKLQRHLKIGDTFVFFMDLSKYRFLSQVMNHLHDMEEDIYNEVSADADIIWDFNEFTNKYGDNNDAICFDLQKVYAEFHKGMKKLSTVFEQADPLNEKEKMNWLLLHLVEKDFVERPRDLPEQLVMKIKGLLNHIAAEHQDVTENYQNLAGEYVSNRSFNRKKSQIEGIITNLLSLLDWMGQRNVAMRDIKPDNLLVAGDFEGHPMLLASAEDYAIGLIDVETAVAIEKEETRKIRQPQLGGTPLYATPSHFFTNALLSDVYKDVSNILLLQDWYAVIGITYELIAGEKLFLKTANKIHHIIQELRFKDEKERHMSKLYWDVSRVFWNIAIEEFDIKMKKAKHKLNAVHVIIPENTEKWFKQDWIQSKRGFDSQSRMIDLRGNDPSKLSAYILLENMFNIVIDNMTAKQPDSVKADLMRSDVSKNRALPVDSESDTRILGFTFTV